MKSLLCNQNILSKLRVHLNTTMARFHQEFHARSEHFRQKISRFDPKSSVAALALCAFATENQSFMAIITAYSPHTDTFILSDGNISYEVRCATNLKSPWNSFISSSHQTQQQQTKNSFNQQQAKQVDLKELQNVCKKMPIMVIVRKWSFDIVSRVQNEISLELMLHEIHPIDIVSPLTSSVLQLDLASLSSQSNNNNNNNKSSEIKKDPSHSLSTAQKRMIPHAVLTSFDEFSLLRIKALQILKKLLLADVYAADFYNSTRSKTQPKLFTLSTFSNSNIDNSTRDFQSIGCKLAKIQLNTSSNCNNNNNSNSNNKSSHNLVKSDQSDLICNPPQNGAKIHSQKAIPLEFISKKPQTISTKNTSDESAGQTEKERKAELLIASLKLLATMSDSPSQSSEEEGEEKEESKIGSIKERKI